MQKRARHRQKSPLIMTELMPFLPGLSPVAVKPLTATFDAGMMSSDGGLVVLREIALKLGLADVITKSLPDDRDPLRVLHSYADMALARMMAIAAGYEDCDDLDQLRTDPALDRLRSRARDGPRSHEPTNAVAIGEYR